MKSFWISFVIVICLISCFTLRNDFKTIQDDVEKLPSYFDSIKFPVNNRLLKKRWELGKKLFYDPVLSKDSSLSCASCHKPELNFADTISFTPGIEGRAANRNTPSLANIAYHPYFLREGSVPTLEMQVLVPIQEKNEFNHNIVEIANQLKDDKTYCELSIQAYSRMPDAYVITRALGCFQRTILSFNSKYDNYLEGKIELTKIEEQGRKLFFSEKTNCAKCHSGFNFTNYSFTNTGLYKEYKDIGRMRFTKDSNDLAKFKVPSLRNVERTYPYMHDGSIRKLSEVIEHYNKGGKNHLSKSDLIKPLGLSQKEKEALEMFLKTLTDYNFPSKSLLP